MSSPDYNYSIFKPKDGVRQKALESRNQSKKHESKAKDLRRVDQKLYPTSRVELRKSLTSEKEELKMKKEEDMELQKELQMEAAEKHKSLKTWLKHIFRRNRQIWNVHQQMLQQEKKKIKEKKKIGSQKLN